MNILITGASGLVGSHFVENFSTENSSNLLTPDETELDITSVQSVKRYFVEHHPNTVMHFAAFTDLTAAEKERGNEDGIVWRVNVKGTQNIADACQDIQSHLIYISTDGVFSGKAYDKGPYSEYHSIESSPENISWYGWTKAKGEFIVSAATNRHTIIRISNPVRAVYLQKLDYLRKILKAYNNGYKLTLFTDQYLTLTYINDVSTSLEKIIKDKLEGICHVSSSNIFTPYNIARYLFTKLRLDVNHIQQTSLTKYLADHPNRYPQFGGLQTVDTQKTLDMNFPTWEEIVDKLVYKYGGFTRFEDTEL